MRTATNTVNTVNKNYSSLQKSINILRPWLTEQIAMIIRNLTHKLILKYCFQTILLVSLVVLHIFFPEVSSYTQTSNR